MNGDIDLTIGADNLTLAELVEDPLVGLMMKSDGIDRSGIEALFGEIAKARPKIRSPHKLAATYRRLSANRSR
jgi:hypothetical protein